MQDLETTVQESKTKYQLAMDCIKEALSELEDYEQPRLLNDLYDHFYAEHRTRKQQIEMRLKAHTEVLDTFKYKPGK